MTQPEITLSEDELHKLTGYERATKQLSVLHARGFMRAYIDRNGAVVLEECHSKVSTRLGA